MALWIELHCDVLSDGPTPPTSHQPFCHSNRGDSPGVMVLNGMARVAVAFLHREARERGWQKTRRGWACPACKTQTEPTCQETPPKGRSFGA